MRSLETDLLVAMEMDLKFSNKHDGEQIHSFQAPRKDQEEDDTADVLAPKVPILTIAQGGTNRILDKSYDTIDLEKKVNPCKLSYKKGRYS